MANAKDDRTITLTGQECKSIRQALLLTIKSQERAMRKAIEEEHTDIAELIRKNVQEINTIYNRLN